MIDFKALETFIWVANLRSFRRAAEKLNTTQPAVSTRIAQLESFLGHRLLERDRRAVAPTPKGQEFLVHAERLIRLREEMIENRRESRLLGALCGHGKSFPFCLPASPGALP